MSTTLQNPPNPSGTHPSIQKTKTLLRLTTSGSVDDGKSTLIGRLLYETGSIPQDQYEAAKKTTEKRGQKGVDLSLLLDGLASEREQGITIDVAYRYFETPKRKFVIADTPGHEQYTRNMVTGASTASLAIVLIDARKGVLTQSRRHGIISSLLGIPHMIVAVNKMDLVDYSEEVFNQIVLDYKEFSQKLDIQDMSFIPVSALMGDNVSELSSNMAWYKGTPLLQQLESTHIAADRNLIDFRFPVQYVIRPHLDYRGFSGRIISGTIQPGEEVVALPSKQTSKIKSIDTFGGPLKEGVAGKSVVLTLEDEIDISRGDMIVRKNNIPSIQNKFEAILCWMDTAKYQPGKAYTIKHTSREAKVFISKIQYHIDVNTLHRKDANGFSLNDIGRVELHTSLPLFFDDYKNNPGTGNFILIDPDSHATVAAGMIRSISRLEDSDTAKSEEGDGRQKSKNVVWHNLAIDRQTREKAQSHKAAVLWFTGYSGSGKSTIAGPLNQSLFKNNFNSLVLDGDNVRHGLCGDLGFNDADRTENIRRVGEVAKLFYETGQIVICTFISPFQKDRDFVRSILPEGAFYEVHVKCDLEVCKRRDPKGLYKKALEGKIPHFTGISSHYDVPKKPEMVVETDLHTLDEIVGQIMERVEADLKFGD